MLLVLSLIWSVNLFTLENEIELIRISYNLCILGVKTFVVTGKKPKNIKM